ncbi:hypothetical protein [Actinoplanes subglobosus]|uniref:FXSXX-COOH protein n=1 Tax=Actinoplanes subglobosus TaxID=1547892 RepID=A0ABV8J5G0_9ACTN
MRQTGDFPVDEHTESALLDVRRMPLETLLRSRDAALDHALARQLDNVRNPGENYAAHGTTPGR